MTGALMAMAGMGGPIVSLSAGTTSHTVVSPTAATAGYQLESDGDVGARGNGTGGAYADIGDWITPKAAAGATYECRVTLVSGTLSSGTTGTWLALSTTRTWTVAATSSVKTCTFTIEIRRASDGAVLASVNRTVTAESS